MNSKLCACACICIFTANFVYRKHNQQEGIGITLALYRRYKQRDISKVYYER